MAFKKPAVLAALAAGAILIGAAGINLFAHCQIPCGIYDDPMRFGLLEEHIRTIEKSMKSIRDLGAAEKPDWNQITRWVANKEEHAGEFSSIVTCYFMAQRLKPADAGDKEKYAKYIRELTGLHEMVIHAMKAKQTTDLANVERLRALVADFKTSYLGVEAAGEKGHDR